MSTNEFALYFNKVIRPYQGFSDEKQTEEGVHMFAKFVNVWKVDLFGRIAQLQDQTHQFLIVCEGSLGNMI